MSRRNNIKKKKIFSIENMIFLVMVTTIIVICNSLSKYKSTLAGKNTATIAVMANSVTTNLTNMKAKPR